MLCGNETICVHTCFLSVLPSILHVGTTCTYYKSLCQNVSLKRRGKVEEEGPKLK